jgi:hypothetical protein
MLRAPLRGGARDPWEDAMEVEGGCYCGAVRYAAEGAPMFKGQCHCRECQYITGGGPNVFELIPKSGFRYTKGAPKTYTRADIDNPVTREFCAECGTHLTTLSPRAPGVILKVGTLDDPSLFGQPQVAIYTKDKQPFHLVAEGVPTFERMPPR